MMPEALGVHRSGPRALGEGARGRRLWVSSCGVAILVALVLMASLTGPAAAQNVKMHGTPFERELGIIPPGTEPARSRPAEADHYPGTGGIIQEPAFFEAPSAATETGRYGIAGWSSPNSPAEPDYSEINGWLTFGFGFTWASPPLAPKRPVAR